MKRSSRARFRRLKIGTLAVLTAGVVAVGGGASVSGSETTTTTTASSSARADHWPGCKTRACDKRVGDRIREKRQRRWLWKHNPFKAVWLYRLSDYARAWTRCVSYYESGHRAVARESGFWGFFQWMIATARAAGLRVSNGPSIERVPWHEQAVKAWRWHLSHPSGQWPNTGENGRCPSPTPKQPAR